MRAFASVIQERCVACGSCAKVCPLGAISVWRGVTAVVDMGRCVGCSKCKQECPAGAISMEKRGETV